MKIGVQVSIAGSLDGSVDRAKQLGCNTMQIFARNPRTFRKTSITKEMITLFKQKLKKLKIKPIAIHIPYTINLAARKDSFYKTSIKEFIDDLLEANELGADFLVTHMGSCKGYFEGRGLMKYAEALRKVMDATSSVKTIILLENTTGSGQNLGYKFSHHKAVFEALNWSERVGVCIDTAHLWGAGYKINDQAGVDSWLAEVKDEVGLKRIKLVHLNDTKEALGSRHDRHCDIGTGNIGVSGFSCMFKHSYLKKLPYVLETPKSSDSDDKRNLKMAREIFKKSNAV